MAIFDPLTLNIGIGFFLVIALAEYSKFRHKAERGFSFLGLSALFFLFSATFAAPVATAWLGSIVWLGMAFELVAWILALIAVVFVTYEVFLV